MVRGKPFSKSLRRLVFAGVDAKPAWMDVVDATRPPFHPVFITRAPPIEYPEDRLRSKFLQKNHFARMVSVNMKANNVCDRHLVDRFVNIQLQLMRQDKLSEEVAYEAAIYVLKSRLQDSHTIRTEGLRGSLSNEKITNEAARLYLASLQDSKRDEALYQVLNMQSAGDSQEGCGSF